MSKSTPPSSLPTPFPTELERNLLGALTREYYWINREFLHNALTKPVFAILYDSTTYLGRWWPSTRTIELSASLIVEHPWLDVTEVLKHEMAHQYVDEVLGGEERPHGPQFRRLCSRLGISARASGIASARNAPTDEGTSPPIFRKIAKLLTLAQSSNTNEAEAAMRAAQKLMLRHNVQTVPDLPSEHYGTRQVGRTTGRTQEWERRLAGILSRHFFVECIWVQVYVPLESKWKRTLEISGTESNLEMASYVHEFLSRTAEQLWREHKRLRELRRDRDRQAYLAGVMAGFEEKLEEQKRSFQEQGLVWKGDPLLDDYVHTRYPHIRTRRSYARPVNEARQRGHQAGKNLVIHRPVTQGSHSPRGRLLNRG